MYMYIAYHNYMIINIHKPNRVYLYFRQSISSEDRPQGGEEEAGVEEEEEADSGSLISRSSSR